MQELFQIQSRIEISKERFNPFGKYRYWKVDDIIKAARPILNELKCVILMEDELVEFMGRPFMKSTAKLVSVETGESIQESAFAELCSHSGMTADQSTGTASTYARKYALCALFAVNDDQETGATKDPDELDGKPARQAGKRQSQPQQRPQQPQPQPVPTDGKPVMTKAKYAKTVRAAAMGQTTADGESVRDWYVREYCTGTKQISLFDQAIADEQARMLTEEQDRADQDDLPLI